MGYSLRCFVYHPFERLILALILMLIFAFGFTLGIHLGKKITPPLPLQTATQPIQTLPDPILHFQPDSFKPTEQAIDNSLDELLYQEVQKTHLHLSHPKPVQLPNRLSPR